VLSRPELVIRKGIRQQLLQLVKNHSHTVTPSRRLEVSPDPDDSMFLECADTARADYLITGNQRHFPILEENQDHNDTRVYQPGCASFNKVAKFRRLCINVESTV